MIGDFNETFYSLWNWKYANSEKDYCVSNSIINDEDQGYFGEVKYKDIGYWHSKLILSNIEQRKVKMTKVEFFNYFDEIQNFDDLELLTEDQHNWLVELEEKDWY